MSEEDIKLQYITPSILSKWSREKITMETRITDGKVNLKGNFVFREKPNYSERVGQVLFGREFSAIDIGLAVENIVLAAAERGLGTCILGMFTESKVKECIGLGKRDKRKVELVIAVGVPVSSVPRPKKRKAEEEIAVYLR